MFVYPEINPIAISMGPIAIAWYGIMYLLGFIAAYLAILVIMVCMLVASGLGYVQCAIL